MGFLFFHSAQTDKNANYYKGKLFEDLLAKYLEATGYDIKTRIKKEGLEYDLEGIHRVSRHEVIGEAKAFSKRIEAEKFNAFCGKFIPLWLENKSRLGLFISTETLTPDAENFYQEKLVKQEINVEVFSGEELLEKISQELKLPNPESLKKQIQSRSLNPLSYHLLTTDHGIFFVYIIGSSESATPSSFAIFRDDSSWLNDKNYLDLVKQKVQELQGLEPIIGEKSFHHSTINRIIKQGLEVGKGWFDYKAPAAPEYFIGRHELIEKIKKHISLGEEPQNTLQVKSRSGVGKSSLLANLNRCFKKEGYLTELHDARDVKNTFDLYYLVQRFTKSKWQASDHKGIEKQLQELRNRLKKNQRGIFMVDQFESMFNNDELFNSYESLISIFNDFKPKLFIVIGRKDDLLTYHDNKISLDKINQLSKIYPLHDFSVVEAKELINKINETSIKKINNEVKSFIYEFSSGFPWLIKRTITHLISYYKKHQQIQGDLFDTGLGLKELFDEELEELNQLEKGFLFRIAPKLPATASELHKEYDEDPLLPNILYKLTKSKILRLSGDTYDTYNDVFKEYLGGKLPKIYEAFTYRLHPKGVLDFFYNLIQSHKAQYSELRFSNEQIKDFYLKQKPQGNNHTVNHLKYDLKHIGLLEQDGDELVIYHSIIDIYQRGELGQYVQHKLKNNALIKELLDKVKQEGDFSYSNLPKYLKDKLIFREAGQDTWSSHAKNLKAWLTDFMILIEDKKSKRFILPTARYSSEEIAEHLANIEEMFTDRKNNTSQREIFLPKVNWEYIEKLAEYLLEDKQIPQNKEGKKLQQAKNDLTAISLVNSQTNKLNFDSIEELKNKIKGTLEKTPYNRVWKAAVRGEKPIQVMRHLLKNKYSDSTVKSRLSVMLNWGQNLEIIPKKRYRHG
ncbi:restriction endonuclease [Okeania sp. SIO2B3]|uniref:nSTAND1 domain-containing NTPase n=1 Tax=Okeania sp. SIO2B3 TaxID=2607784 RepID=UPI0013C1615E|nr:restriction endonuclease [Okeania sp. SIO2B3]NET43943.1 restriction endonuclease [Okeania sp. SIO2B3]